MTPSEVLAVGVPVLLGLQLARDTLRLNRWSPALFRSGPVVVSDSSSLFRVPSSIPTPPVNTGLFYVASPGGGPSTAFRLTEADEHHVRFENPEHDFPKVIEYTLEEEGQLRARVSGDEGPGGTWLFEKAAELD